MDAFSQAYFLSLPDVEETFNRKIVRFHNDDLLVGDSSDEGLYTNVNGKVFLTRIDNCGNVVWSFSYERTEEYLELKDVVIDKEEQIYAYGSAYQGGREMLFVLKAKADGHLVRFRLLNTGTIDHFSYDMDIYNDQLLLYGLLLDFNTQKQGFVTVVNDALQVKWSRRFAPFESEGQAIFNTQGEIICRSGPYHYAFSNNGEKLWSKQLFGDNGVTPFAGPIEIRGGYLYQGFVDGKTFFYKLNSTGELQWLSKGFAAKKVPSEIKKVTEEETHITFVCAEKGKYFLKNIVLYDQDGSVIAEEILKGDFSINVDQISKSIDKAGNVTILGHKALVDEYAVDEPYFLLQYPMSAIENSCFAWIGTQTTEDLQLGLSMLPFDSTFFSTEMDEIPETSGTQVLIYEFDVEDRCGFKLDPIVDRLDSLVACETEWTIALPDEFIWLDGHQAKSRHLDSIGVYVASNRNCLEPEQIEFDVQRPACDCNFFVPTAFSPNADGVNDYLNIYSDCEVLSIRMTVFDRWGNSVSTVSTLGWDGSGGDGPAPAGIYVAKIECIVMSPSGQELKHQTHQAISLLR